MSRKRALVVDDSKSARVILSRMLEKYDLDVDMAESAEQALEYLQSNRPDAIFMDHLMPGMDGLQAVQAIKGNPNTATIPIMMYTSQEGELYVGQARALGAMGVLPKQVRPVDVSKVLHELHLLAERRDASEPALVPVGAPAHDSTEAAPAPVAVRPPAPEASRRIEALIREQSADLRRFVVASLDSFALRLVNDLRQGAPPSGVQDLPRPVPAPPHTSTPTPSPRRPAWPWALLAGAGALVAILGAMCLTARADLSRARAESAALSAGNLQLQNTERELRRSLSDLTAALGAAASPAPGASPAGAASAGDREALAPRSETVPYGELPFDRGRLDALREVLTKLEAQNFRGAVKVTHFAGLFCLSGNPTDGYAVASAALPVGRCDLIGNPFDDSSPGQLRQSLAFANLVASVRQRTSGAISVTLDNGGATRPIQPYPQRTDSLTAGDWNRAAAANNRVEFVAEPAGPH